MAQRPQSEPVREERADPEQTTCGCGTRLGPEPPRRHLSAPGKVKYPREKLSTHEHGMITTQQPLIQGRARTTSRPLSACTLRGCERSGKQRGADQQEPKMSMIPIRMSHSARMQGMSARVSIMAGEPRLVICAGWRSRAFIRDFAAFRNAAPRVPF